MTDEEFIRDRAALNWSRNMVCQALDISPWKFREICTAMPDVKWPAPGKSLDARRAAQTRDNAPTAIGLMSAWPARSEKSAQYSVGGFTGSLPQVAAHWADFISIGLFTVRRRLKENMSIENALFMPARPTCAVSTKGNYWSRSNG